MAQFGINGAITIFDKLVLVEVNQQGRLLLHEFEDVSKGLKSIKECLNTVKAYLNDTEGREGTEGFKDRKKRVQELEYETEDAIDKFMFEVPEHFHNYWITKFLHNMYHSIKDPKHIKELSTKIKDIESEIQKLKVTDTIREGVSSSSSAEIRPPAPEAYHPLSHRDEIFMGINQKPREKLLSLLLNKKPREVVVSVLIGNAGSGKTTLTHQVYGMLTGEGNLRSNEWIDVPHSIEELKKTCEAKVVPVFEEKNYILVLDNICSEEEWDYVKSLFPNKNHGGRIIISTRNRHLASHICATSPHPHHIIEVNPLTRKEAWEALFCKKVFQGSQCPNHLLEWSQKIVELCDGLPHAIVAAASSLSDKPRTVEEFKRVHDRLKYDPGNHVGHLYIKRFLKSYYLLKPMLKSCLLYFCNFPENYYVPREKLVHLWIAEEFIEVKRGKTLEEVADEFLDELVRMSLIRVPTWCSEGRIRSFRVSNLVRGFLLSNSEKEKLCIILKTSDTSPDERTRCLSLHNCYPNMSRITNGLSRGRTFFMFGEVLRSESTTRVLLSNFKYLKVLDLENADLVCFPKEIVNLILLRYLSLRNTRIMSVPKSIKKLLNLVILDLRQTFVTELPKAINELPKLQYLLVDGDRVGVEVSRN